MKKLLSFAIGSLFAGAAIAQSTSVTTSDKTPAGQVQMTALCKRIQDYNTKKAEARRALVRADFATAKIDFADAAVMKKQIKADAAVLVNEGVSRPIRLAHKEIKKADNLKIMADIKTIQADKIANKAAVKAGDAAMARCEQTAIATDKKVLRQDIKAAKRDAGWHFAFIRANKTAHS